MIAKKIIGLAITTIILILGINFSASALSVESDKITLVGKIGFQFAGQYHEGLTNTQHASQDGYSLSSEFLVDGPQNFAFGGGIEYQLRRNRIGHDDDYRFIPLYAVGKYTIPLGESVDLFINGKVGYNFASYKNNGAFINRGGTYVAGGGGFILGNMYIFELNYAVYGGDFNFQAKKDNYATFNVAFGVNLDF